MAGEWKRMTGLYLHIPFCLSKCTYCDFYSCVSDEPGLRDRFLSALDRELAGLARPAPETVFIGGGTPTALTATQLERLLEQLHARVDLDAVTEWSCEVNPGTVTAEKLALLKAGGVNRLSIGAQAFDDARLRQLGRIHSNRDIFETVALARSAGFDELNLDLISGTPGLTLPAWETELNRLVELRPQHVSCYSLTVEEGTPLQKQALRGEVELPDEEESRRQFERTAELLEAAGFEQYEISNYARSGHRCRHNLLYWTDGAYYGCGPAAHTHWDGVRRANAASLEEYCRRMETSGSATVFEEQLEPDAKAREVLVFGLRCLDGIEHRAFERRTGFDPFRLCAPDLRELIEEGWMVDDGRSIRLSREALFISDTLFARLI